MDTDTQFQHALHETCHALLAVRNQFALDAVRCAPVAETVVRWPFPVWGLGVRYAYNPQQTRFQLGQIVGTLIAPYAALGEPLQPELSDSADLEDWHQAWDAARARADLSWYTVKNAAWLQARRWLTPRLPLARRVAAELV